MKNTPQNHDNPATANLTLQVLSNIAAKHGYERTAQSAQGGKNGPSALVSHLGSEEESLLLRAIGAERKAGGAARDGLEGMPKRPRAGNSSAMVSLDELARQKY